MSGNTYLSRSILAAASTTARWFALSRVAETCGTYVTAAINELVSASATAPTIEEVYFIDSSLRRKRLGSLPGPAVSHSGQSGRRLRGCLGREKGAVLPRSHSSETPEDAVEMTLIAESRIGRHFCE